MASHSITINNLPVLASSDVKWALREGVRPVVMSFDMTPAHADQVAASGGPVTLSIDHAKIRNLYALWSRPGEHPFIKRVVLADRRWMWSYRFVRRYFNMRRNVGFKRIQDPASPPENLSVVPRVWYRRWTLQNEADGADPRSAKWRPSDALRNVLEEVTELEQETFGIRPDIQIGNTISRKLNALDMENVVISDPGDQAVNRLLRYLPEAALYIDYDGKIVVYSKADGTEGFEVELAGPKVVGEGDVSLVANARIRPREVHVLFQFEPEVRFDFHEIAVSVTADDRYAENVLPIPDFSLLVNGQTLAQGTWLSFPEALVAWGTPPGFSGPLTNDILQKASVPFLDLWAGIRLSGAFQPDADWASRIAAINTHYRTTFRINRHWIDRILGMKPYRVATVDQSTGTRAPAIAYGDYAVLTGQRALFNEAIGGVASKDFSYIVNVKGYPLDGKIASANSAQLRASPAHIRILDADQGIIHVDYQIDPYRLFEAILPSMVTMSAQEGRVDGEGRPLFAGPTADITRRGRPVSFDALASSSAGNIPKLTADHNVSFILTVLPGAPNDKRALFRVAVKPSDVSDLLPTAAQRGLHDAHGPIMEIYIGSGVETARVPWLDDRAQEIEKIFGVGEGDPQVREIVLNAGRTVSGAASLDAIARAAAARLYASLTDRIEGQMAGALNPNLRPGGWLSEVEHIISADGKALSKLKLPERIEAFDLFSFLDGSTRAIILKLADPGNAS